MVKQTMPKSGLGAANNFESVGARPSRAQVGTWQLRGNASTSTPPCYGPAARLGRLGHTLSSCPLFSHTCRPPHENGALLVDRAPALVPWTEASALQNHARNRGVALATDHCLVLALCNIL